MSIIDQYTGFLASKSLSKVASLLEIPSFNFERLSKDSLKIDSLNINIPDNEVLGKRIEHFFEHSVINSKHYELISKNIQVFKDKITIGEIDFIVKDVFAEEILHIELIYKFYLYDPKMSPELERWIGPNRKDTLLRKVEKLKTHQFPLLYREETKSILKELKLKPQEIKQEVCYLANLFLPASLKEKAFLHPNTEYVVGYWIKPDEFTHEKYGNFQFFIPKKHDWIANPETNNSWFSYQDILKPLNEVLEQKKSPLLWLKRNEDSYERLFIVWW